MGIEKTTPRWQQIPGMKEVHHMLRTSFTNLRLVESPTNLQRFTEVIEDLRERHKPVVPLLAQAAKGLKDHDVLDDVSIDAWLGKFMNSRIGTEMLTKHYISLLNASDEAHVGIVDTKCNPARICEEVIDHVRMFYSAQISAMPSLNALYPQIAEPAI